MLAVASPPTAGNDARYKAREYARIGVCEYWRLDPEGSVIGTALEGYVACGGGHDPVDSIERLGKRWPFRGRVLGLDLRSQTRDGAMVLLFSNPQTGEEFDGALEEAERRRQIAQQCASAAENRAQAEEVRADAAENRLGAAEERARALEEQLRNLTGRTRQPGRDS